MTIAAIIISGLAVIVSGCSVYWTMRARKAYRRLAEIRATREREREPLNLRNAEETARINEAKAAAAERRMRDQAALTAEFGSRRPVVHVEGILEPETARKLRECATWADWT